ncbi:LGFP repeat-containing protein [Stigmatella aurantiaca]|uniref:N-acetylmuramoyl-L-alanine amidase n=1 Tax=Stigmatella aurantiaca TaxID=41 RepID=A0A1H8DKR2_STIAU|nr:N-acetylmuramoyl-L-alanine amidase [Stigmatella aurantiaca]SEN07869.1 LGFP repeat-containing protein [Stigmatella aurantiaca]
MKNRHGMAVLTATLALAQACGSNETPQELPVSAVERGVQEMDPARAEVLAREDSASDALFRDAGQEFGVPPALLKAIAFVQTRYQMVEGAEEFEGRPAVFGMMALTEDLLKEGAKRAGVTAAEARTDARSNVRAAAALLSHHSMRLGLGRNRAADWAPAVEAISGIPDAQGRRSFSQDEVFRVLRLGLGTLSEEGAASGLAPEEGQAPPPQLLAGPDYAPAVWRPSPNYNARPMGVRMVIIHTCESSYAGCWSWLTNSTSGVSAHYVVREDGQEISQLVRDGSRGWHIGATFDCKNNGGVECGLNGKSSNDFTIGIEHGGYAAQTVWPAGQLDASARLLCDITRDHGVPRDRYHVVGHGQLQPYNRTDPGANWPWTDYLNRANAACGTGCVLQGDIKAKYDAVNGAVLLGKCQTGENTTPDGVGRYNAFERGSIYWTPATGAHVVHGLIRDRWAAVNWEQGPLGYPITDEMKTPDGVGRYNHFQKGSIYWTPETGAWEVHGFIRQKWEALDWERSELGYPTTGEMKTPDGVGRYNHFKKGAVLGSIYWTPATGAHEVHGQIRARWEALGWERSALGYPVSDEENTSFAPGKVGRFQGGHIYWSSATGARWLEGAILQKFLEAGVAQTLGFPKSEAYAVSGGRRVDFERGALVHNTSTGAVTVVQ